MAGRERKTYLMHFYWNKLKTHFLQCTSPESCLNMLSLHSFLSPRQLQGCLKKSVCFPTWKYNTNICPAACWKVEEVHSKGPSSFWERTGGAKIFSVCRSIPAKCMSSVFSSQLCYLSNWGFLCIVKLLGFKQYAVNIYMYTHCIYVLVL